MNKSNSAAFITYASYTLHVLEDQLESVDTLWFPKFGTYNLRFREQIEHHEYILNLVTEIKPLLKGGRVVENASSVAQHLEHLSWKVNEEFDSEELFINELADLVPLEDIRELEKKQEERRLMQVKAYGHLWTAVYLLRGLAPEERAIFPPGIPKIVVSGMLTAGALQFRK